MELFLLPRDRTWRYKIWPRDQEPAPGTVVENTEYRFELAGVDRPDEAYLQVDGEELEALRSPREGTAAWRWNPGFFAGSIEVVIRHPSAASIAMELDVDPQRAKLTRDEFHLMVEEILKDSLALFSISPFRFGVARGAGADRPPIARLEFLRSVAQQVERDLAEIARDPARALQAETFRVPLGRAKGARGVDLIRSLRHGRLLELDPASQSRLGLRFLPSHVEVPKKVEHFSTREHRAIKGFLISAEQWLYAVSGNLSRATPEGIDDHITRRWARRCSELARRFSKLQELPFLRGVSPDTGALMLTETFRRRAPYRRLMRSISHWHLGIARVSGDYLQLPLSRTFDLYELWAYIRILRAAITCLGATTVDPSELITRDPGTAALKLSTTSARVSVGKGLRLNFQRSYREYWKEASGTGSFTREMIPDLSLDCEGVQGILVIDAKYRVDSGLADSLTSVHTYRDAIVHENGDEAITRAVLGAYIVCPVNPSANVGNWKEIGVQPRLFHPLYRRKFKVGAFSLRPGMKDAEVVGVLREVLQDAGWGSETGSKPADSTPT